MDLTIPSSFDGLPLQRAKAVAACRRAQSDERVLGMCIGGSFAGGAPDVYSDVDLKLVVEDSAAPAVAAGVEALARAAGNVVAFFPGDHLGFDHLFIVLYDDLVHVDFLVLPLAGLAAESSETHVAVLWERGDALTSRIAERVEDSVVDVEWFERRVWTWLWYGQTKVLRGEVHEALDMLAYLRARVLFPLLAASRGVRPAAARRAESLTRDLAPAFRKTLGGPDRVEALEAFRAAAGLYELLSAPLLESRGIAPASEARAVVRAALDAGLEWEPGHPLPESESVDGGLEGLP
ncbi:MAG TPA: nucleotidyltransferase domain-containing protein [Actinomycetota bacterium]|nr:nucleotidyltransferase domain-containing protein [Actinomycetota bacterium]